MECVPSPNQAPMVLHMKVLANGEGLPVPAYKTPGAVAVDLHAALPEGKTVNLAPLQRAGIPTGIAVAVPAGFEGQIRARSGRALNDGLSLINGVGTIDQDYRGELIVAVVNLSNWPISIKRGERIAQFVIVAVAKPQYVVVPELDDTTRGAQGFGSTGK